MDDFQSQLGYLFCLNGGVVSWRSSKQGIVADLTIEGENIVASNAANQAVWTRNFITRLCVVPNITSPMELYCDNNGPFHMPRNLESHQLSKHILRCFRIVRGVIEGEVVKICKVSTNDNVVDPLAKPLP